MNLAVFLHRVALVKKFHIRDLTQRLYSKDFPMAPVEDLRKFMNARLVDEDGEVDEADEITIFLHEISGRLFYQFNLSKHGRTYPWTFDTNRMVVIRIRNGFNPYIIIKYLPHQ